MTNEELKKKIISALQSVEFVTEKGWCGQCISLRLDYSAIADALIAAGFGDIREAEHRAEVYYEALLSAAAYGDTPPDYYIKQTEKELAEEGKDERRNVNV